MKKNTFIIVIVTHTITSLYPIIPQWTLGIGQWNTYITRVMCVASKNLAVKSDFSQMRPSGSGFDYEHGVFHSDRSDV